MNDQLITRELLDEFGIAVGDQDEASLLGHLNTMLDQRIGAEITDSLDDSKLQELLSLQENGTEEQVDDWIEKNVPELEQIVQDETDIFLGEIAENRDNINNAV